MQKYVVEPLPITNIFLGEGPHWDDKAQKLYYVDIFAKSVHRYDPVTGRETKVVIRKSELKKSSAMSVIALIYTNHKNRKSVHVIVRLFNNISPFCFVNMLSQISFCLPLSDQYSSQD
jgi:hypothetical protein